MQILVVEDDHNSAQLLYKTLTKEGYICDLASTLKEADTSLSNATYDLLILDWNLPDGDGIELLKDMRSYDQKIPVLMLSARADVNDKVTALDFGADDYLSKPFSHIELLARVRTLLRRNSTQKSNIITANNVTLDLNSRVVSIDENVLALTPIEFNLLELLMRNKNRTISRYQITEHLTDNLDSTKMSNFVDVHVKNLRAKLAPEQIIKTVRGIGYTIINSQS